MPATWQFKPLYPGDTTRDPITGEFFSTDAIRNPAEALVREAVQNSLDARAGEAPVGIRFYIPNKPLPAHLVLPFTENLSPHLSAKRNGLGEPPDVKKGCKVLVIEDFHTTGLTGDPHQWKRIDGVQNRFFAFFRAEGESDKSGNDRGRWGVGKFVFPRSSDGSTFFGVTRRASDDKSLMLGRCILKSHSVGSQQYVPDGYFGERKQIDGGEMTVPVTDADTIGKFVSAFTLRRTTEPGLSVVVPWVTNEITRESIIEALLRDYFYSILTKELDVFVEDEEKVTILSPAKIDDALATAGDKVKRDVAPLVALARFALATPETDIFVLGQAHTKHAAAWHDGIVTGDAATQIRARLEADNRVRLRIPVTVKPKGQPPVPSHFDVVLARDTDAEDSRPVFIREGIVVSDARGSRIRGYRALVLCESGALATLLGDSENPSHTEWRSDSANFKNRYTYGGSYIRFVQESVSKVVQALHASEDKEDRNLLLDFFALPEEEQSKRNNSSTKKPGGNEEEDEPKVPVRSRPRFALSRVPGGFSVRRGDPQASTPKRLRVRVAYDVRRGNPFKRYQTADFELLKGGVKWKEDPAGIQVETLDGNRMEIRVTDSDFAFAIQGFDENRDLIVDIEPVADEDDDETV